MSVGEISREEVEFLLILEVEAAVKYVDLNDVVKASELQGISWII